MPLEGRLIDVKQKCRGYANTAIFAKGRLDNNPVVEDKL
jgi:hypothetical protein